MRPCIRCPTLVNLPASTQGWILIHHCVAVRSHFIEILDTLYYAGADMALTNDEHHCIFSRNQHLYFPVSQTTRSIILLHISSGTFAPPSPLRTSGTKLVSTLPLNTAMVLSYSCFSWISIALVPCANRKTPEGMLCLIPNLTV